MLLTHAVNAPSNASESRVLGWDEVISRYRTLFLGGEEIGTGISSAEKLSPVAAAHRILCNGYALIPFDVYQKDGDARRSVKDENLAKVLKHRPNPNASPFNLRHTQMSNAYWWGWGAIWNVRDAHGAITERYALPSDCGSIRRDPETGNYWYPSIIRITKRRGNLLSVPVVVAHKSNKALIETFDINLPAAINTTYVAWNFEVDEDCLYICSATGTTIASKGTMKVARIYLDDRRSEYFEVVNNTGVALESNSNFFAYIHQGLVYAKTSGNVVYTINLTDPTDWTKLSGTLKTSSCRPVAAQNGRVMYFYYSYANYGTDSSYLSIANGKRKMIETPTANGMHSCGSGVYYRQYIPYRDGFHWAGPSNCCYIKNYIATINNLSRTIEKTSDKTMKITYTIQEV